MILLTFQLKTAWQTKASAKADVDIHPDFRTLMEHKAFLSTCCKTFLHTKEKEVVFLNTLKISLLYNPPKKDRFR